MDTDNRQRIALVAALDVIAKLRRDQMVISSMGTAREWPKMSEHPLDLHYVPSTMGGAVPLGLGLALARKNRDVIVFSGDGSLLMSLGSLVTVAGSDATNLSIVLFDNGIYEVTGGQPTAAAGADTNFEALAQAAGIGSVVSFESLGDWQSGAEAAFQLPGPRLIVLQIEPVGPDEWRLSVPGPMRERLERFRQALAADQGNHNPTR